MFKLATNLHKMRRTEKKRRKEYSWYANPHPFIPELQHELTERNDSLPPRYSATSDLQN